MIEEKTLKKFVHDGLSTYKIAKELKLSQSTIKHWLKKYGLKTQRRAQVVNCALCEKQNNKRICQACRTKIRRYRTKAAAIKFLGGKCVKCRWDGEQAGFEFHHLYDKDFQIGNVANKSWETIKIELRKCELICSRCHRIEHSTREDAKFLEEVEKYKGRLLDF